MVISCGNLLNINQLSPESYLFDTEMLAFCHFQHIQNHFIKSIKLWTIWRYSEHFRHLSPI
jgi:hypothetical protein